VGASKKIQRHRLRRSSRQTSEEKVHWNSRTLEVGQGKHEHAEEVGKEKVKRSVILTGFHREGGGDAREKLIQKQCRVNNWNTKQESIAVAGEKRGT